MDLKDMTLEELWRLFPIVLVPHQPQWRAWARQETALLSERLADYAPRIHHIGSTAIPGIAAKPIIDILVEVSPDFNARAITERMERHGYIRMSAADRRLSFNKGYTPAGYAAQVFHIHIRAYGDNDEIYFRDYLIAHPDVARAYEALKTSLLPKYRNDRDGYTQAKTDFVRRVTATAKGTLIQPQ